MSVTKFALNELCLLNVIYSSQTVNYRERIVEVLICKTRYETDGNCTLRMLIKVHLSDNEC